MENMQSNLYKTPTAPRRVQPLEKPVVYEPTVSSFAKPQVKPVTYTDEHSEKDHFLLGGFLLISALFGLISGILIQVFPGSSYQLPGLLGYGDGGIVAHCLIYGAVVGALVGLVLYPIYSRLKHVLPVYACFLFIPVLLFALTPLLSGLTTLVFAAVKAVLSLLAIGVVLFIAYSWFFG